MCSPPRQQVYTALARDSEIQILDQVPGSMVSSSVNRLPIFESRSFNG